MSKETKAICDRCKEELTVKDIYLLERYELDKDNRIVFDMCERCINDFDDFMTEWEGGESII